VSVATRITTHLEANVDSCDSISGKVFYDKAEGRVHSCLLVDKGTCNPNNPNDCDGWKKDVACTADDWKNGTPCSDDDPRSSRRSEKPDPEQHRHLPAGQDGEDRRRSRLRRRADEVAGHRAHRPHHHLHDTALIFVTRASERARRLSAVARSQGWCARRAPARASGLQLMPGGAKSVARGGAVAARPDDPMLLLNDPAGLAL